MKETIMNMKSMSQINLINFKNCYKTLLDLFLDKNFTIYNLRIKDKKWIEMQSAKFLMLQSQWISLFPKIANSSI